MLPIQTILQQLKHDVPHVKWSLEIGDEKMLEESLLLITTTNIQFIWKRGERFLLKRCH